MVLVEVVTSQSQEDSMMLSGNDLIKNSNN